MDARVFAVANGADDGCAGEALHLVAYCGRVVTTSMIHVCAHPACSTLTLGRFCLGHEVPVRRVFTRGRPFARLLPAEIGTSWLTEVGRDVETERLPAVAIRA